MTKNRRFLVQDLAYVTDSGPTTKTVQSADIKYRNINDIQEISLSPTTFHNVKMTTEVINANNQEKFKNIAHNLSLGNLPSSNSP